MNTMLRIWYQTMSKLCEFLTYDNIHFKCKRCGTELRFTEYQVSEPVFVCNNVLKKDHHQTFPNFIKKIKNFAQATVGHFLKGMPICDDSTIEKRYKICQGCDHFVSGSCSLCGCPLHRNRRFISKLAWSEQKCPINKW